MKLQSILTATLLVAHCFSPAWAQDSGKATHADYVRLLRATKYVESYKRQAVVSARVFGARAQGSDLEYAKFMGAVANADLTGVDDCLANVYGTQNLSKAEVARLVDFFESPLGVKLLDRSSAMLLADIERGRHEPISPDAFSADEKLEIARLQQDSAYQKYGVMVSSKGVANGLAKCIMESEPVKASLR